MGMKMNLQLFAGFDGSGIAMTSAKVGRVPVGMAEEILSGVKAGSAFMKLAKAVPIDRPETRFTHMSGVGAFWVDEAQRIETSKPTWLQVTLRTKKLAVIIPTTKENLNHSVGDFFELMKPEIVEALHRKFDAAALGGVDNPFEWSVLTSAQAAGNVMEETQSKYEDINVAMGAIEAADFDPNGIAALKGQKRKYRATKDEGGMPVFAEAQGEEAAHVLGQPTAFLHNGTLAGTQALEFVGDWNQAVYGILRGIEYEILTEATLTTIEASDAPGKPVSLAERDMVALKAVLDIGMMVVQDGAFVAITQ